ncbi:MAG TPA: DUF1549 domain-containing protein, partial [Planctomycetaceae bacterium]|nr:DUF1549 domain-containing protein [Planctomycetaceae bacterium]
ITPEERAFWSFQPIADLEPPRIEDLPDATAIDRFVMQKLRAENLKPMPPATRQELIRRATFDLTGLPPSPGDIRAFLEDGSNDAFAKVVGRLLESKTYGERWGRHWLDVVRYADTAGETADYPTPLGYKYRNWVIDAFNDDMPYDQFVREQLAGDILAHQAPDLTPEEFKQKYAATGFIAISRRFGFDVENYHHLTIQDTIDVVGQSMLGLTLGCARCHDHKFDPVNMSDYYAWYGIFQSTRYSFPGSEEKKRPYDIFPALPPRIVAERQSQFDQRVASLESEIANIESELKTLAESSPEKAVANEALLKRQTELAAERDALKNAGPFTADELIYGAIESTTPANARVQLRGEPGRPGDEIPRRNLDILGGDPIPADAGSGRLQLAQWLTRDDNPLMARVMVNRIWQQHFGRGLVGTEND